VKGTMNMNRLPETLKLVKRWVLWKSETRHGKTTKVPYRLCGHKKASSTEPSSWGGFNEAFAASSQRGCGIGIVLGDGITGFDFDWKDTAEPGIPAIVQTLVETLGSYAEFSPSGRGVHVLVSGKKPSWATSKAVLAPGITMEAYSHSRFFTVTGDRIPGSSNEVVQRQEAIEAICEQYLKPSPTVAAMPAQSKGLSQVTPDLIARSRVAPLWAGDISGYASQSEADLALAGYLMWVTGNDISEADRLFRMSALYRDKWDRRLSANSGITYGQATLQKAAQVRTREQNYRPPRSAVEYAVPTQTPQLVEWELLESSWGAFDFAAAQILGLGITKDNRLAIPYQDDINGQTVGAVTVDFNKQHNSLSVNGVWVFDGDNPPMAHVSTIVNAPHLWLGLGDQYADNAYVGVGRSGLTEKAAAWLASLGGPIVLWFESTGGEYQVLEQVKGQLIRAGVDRRNILIPGDDYYGRDVLELRNGQAERPLRARLLNAKSMRTKRTGLYEGIITLMSNHKPNQRWTLAQIWGEIGVNHKGGRLKRGEPVDQNLIELLTDDRFYTKAAIIAGNIEKAKKVVIYAYMRDTLARNAIRYRLSKDGYIPMNKVQLSYAHCRGKGLRADIKHLSMVDLLAEVVAKWSDRFFKTIQPQAYQGAMQKRHTFWKNVYEKGTRVGQQMLSSIFPFHNVIALKSIGVMIV